MSRQSSCWIERIPPAPHELEKASRTSNPKSGTQNGRLQTLPSLYEFWTHRTIDVTNDCNLKNPVSSGFDEAVSVDLVRHIKLMKQVPDPNTAIRKSFARGAHHKRQQQFPQPIVFLSRTQPPNRLPESGFDFDLGRVDFGSRVKRSQMSSMILSSERI
jgi:hypothetical protein